MADRNETFSFAIIDGPSLLELMLCHYDPTPLPTAMAGCRRCHFKLGGNQKLLLDVVGYWGSTTPVLILGTSREHPLDDIFTFHGETSGSESWHHMKATGSYNTKTRKGRMRLVRKG